MTGIESAAARTRAGLLGVTYYTGSACKRCGGEKRYVSNGACFRCANRSQLGRSTKAATLRMIEEHRLKVGPNQSGGWCAQREGGPCQDAPTLEQAVRLAARMKPLCTIARMGEG